MTSLSPALRGAEMLVATDLDGCLLDEATYGFEPARPALERLAARGVPLVLATSKTRSEIEALWEPLRAAAAIVENGGAVLVRAAGDGPPPAAPAIVLGEKREVLVQALRDIARETGTAVRSFTAMSAEEIARRTGLAEPAAVRALRREYDEPFVLEDETRAAAVMAAAQARGLRITRGGRFWHLTGETDKGRGLRALLGLHAGSNPRRTVVVLGDSPNDVPMLRMADRPVVLPRPDGAVDPLVSAAVPAAERAARPGPEGWNAAVLAILAGERLPVLAPRA